MELLQLNVKKAPVDYYQQSYFSKTILTMIYNVKRFN